MRVSRRVFIGSAATAAVIAATPPLLIPAPRRRLDSPIAVGLEFCDRVAQAGGPWANASGLYRVDGWHEVAFHGYGLQAEEALRSALRFVVRSRPVAFFPARLVNEAIRCEAHGVSIMVHEHKRGRGTLVTMSWLWAGPGSMIR